MEQILYAATKKKKYSIRVNASNIHAAQATQGTTKTTLSGKAVALLFGSIHEEKAGRDGGGCFKQNDKSRQWPVPQTDGGRFMKNKKHPR